MALPIVAVVGRPNVGKSTFVNRIAQADEAIVHEMRGVTRDRSYHESPTGTASRSSSSTRAASRWATTTRSRAPSARRRSPAMHEADAIVFLVDGRTGINADDEEVARILRKTDKPVFLVVNKMDDPDTMRPRSGSSTSLGLATRGRSPRCTATARATCSTPWSRTCRSVEAADDEEEDELHQRRHHRPPQRRQVLADQPA